MAERRMFTQKITESDAFIEMPMSSQALYFHLCMNADDDGFVKNPKSIQRLVGCNDDDLRLLIAKRFILPFETGVIVIKHWRMHNLLRKDRYKETVYSEERAMLYLKKDGAYTLDSMQGKPLPRGAAEAEEIPEEGTATDWQPNGNQMAPQVSIGKDSIELVKDSIVQKERKKIERDFHDTREEEYVSHSQIMDELGVSGLFRETLEGFLRSCYANKHLVTNDKLKDIILRLNKYYGDDEEEKVASLQDAISGGFFDVIENRKAPPGWRY